jgi:uncharacterized coiled-coil protein SlyX
MKVRIAVSAMLLIITSTALGQQASSTGANSSDSQLADAVRQLEAEISQLQNSVAELRSEADRYRAQTQELERRLEAISPTVTAPSAQPAPQTSSAEPEQAPSTSTSARLAKLEDEYSLLTGKVDDQYQTKVESGSRYRVRLSGLVMLNMFSNRGVPDSIDNPGVAIPSYGVYGTGSVAGTLRQSQMGVEIFGPEWAGARVSGDLRFDFAGGFPDTDNGSVLGLMRLRTGNVRVNWSHTSITVGQDAPMFSAISPTSLISLAQPEFAYAGNLWTWVPQVQMQHWVDLGNSQRVHFSAGILDPLTGETPRGQFYRAAGAGELSRQPGYSVGIGWSGGKEEDHPPSLNVGGYFSRQNWGFNRVVDGWAGTADWQIPLVHRLALKGEFFRGQALGGFGASSGESVVYSDVLQNPFAIVRGLDDVGGWSQLSVQATPTFQFNAGYGLDNPFSKEIRQFAARQNVLYPGLGKNSSAMGNVIYRPRSDLLFSLEYRHIASSRLTNVRASADNIGMGIGLLF